MVLRALWPVLCVALLLAAIAPSSLNAEDAVTRYSDRGANSPRQSMIHTTKLFQSSPPFASQNCRPDGEDCDEDDDCCSGYCEKGKKGAGICAEDDY